MSNVITILALSDYPIHSYPKNTSILFHFSGDGEFQV